MTKKTLPSRPLDIRVFGKVSEAMRTEFVRQQAEAQPSRAVVLELSTSGGDADVDRRIAQEIRLWREKEGRELFFLGKT